MAQALSPAVPRTLQEASQSFLLKHEYTVVYLQDNSLKVSGRYHERHMCLTYAIVVSGLLYQMLC